MSTSKYSIQKAVILGSGVMGSQIAAHAANAGLEVLLLDLKSDDKNRPDKIAEEALKKTAKMKPAPFASPGFVHRIKTGNFDDDMDKLAEADWICEVVVERPDVKKQILAKIDAARRPDSIVSSNTSGLSVTGISEDCSGSFKEHFLGTHFFNPPRYMKLLEIIPTEHTAPQVIDFMQQFCEQTLGKGVVLCKDTPNFVANRLGVFSMAGMISKFFDGSFRAEEIDVLTGTLTGYSKAATFRTADMAGLDVTLHVADNILPNIPDDERKEVFALPEKFREMVNSGKHGNKTGGGFYKKVKSGAKTEYLVINPQTLEYEPQTSLKDELLAQASAIRSTAERLKFLAFSEGRLGSFIWQTQKDLLLYAANRIPEISDFVQAVDRAMKWGFNWELGPFERWDALGIREVAEKLEAEGEKIPALISEMLKNNISRFYDNGRVYNPVTGAMEEEAPAAEGEIKIPALRKQHKPVLENDSAALHDMGDGVALFEFKTRNHTLGFELVQTLYEALDVVKKEFRALVIGHDGTDFAFGADLAEAGSVLQAGGFGKMEETVANFQKTAVALRYAPFPVVAAPFGRTLGGGVEFVLYSDKAVAHLETYMGLVEAGVGLVPAGGGTTEMLRRAMAKPEGDADPMPFVREVFKTIGMAKVSESAYNAKELNLLRNSDVIVMNRDLQLKVAKQEALTLAESGYRPPVKTPVKVLGRKMQAAMKLMLYVMHESKFITDYDQIVVGRVADILSGGDLSEAQEVPEEYLLRLEREAILACFKDKRTQARIEHLLTTGKPLRN